MAKNNQLINLVKNTMKNCKQDVYVKELTASFVIALAETTNLEPDDISEVLADAMSVWNRAVTEGINLLAWSKELTGIDIEGRV